jgi:hypothetical protein
MKRPGRHLPPLFQDLPEAHSGTAPEAERNVLEDVPGHLSSLARQTYEVSEELKFLIIRAIILAAVTTWVFPVLPDSVNVGGWALWWLGGAITGVMEWVAHLWVVAVVLGGLSFFLALWLVVASHWLTRATKREQLLMYVSVVLIIPNLLALLAIVVLWAVVVLIWTFIICIPLAIIGLLISAWGYTHNAGSGK